MPSQTLFFTLKVLTSMERLILAPEELQITCKKLLRCLILRCSGVTLCDRPSAVRPHLSEVKLLGASTNIFHHPELRNQALPSHDRSRVVLHPCCTLSFATPQSKTEDAHAFGSFHTPSY